MTATHAKESQEDRICSKGLQREFGLIAAMDNAQMMMMKKTSNESSSSSSTIFDRCFSDKLKRFTEIETTSEGSSSTSEEEEYSPKSVEEFGLKRFVHHQVLKIKEEDSHIGEDIRESLNKQQFALILILSRPILPSSPLSGKNSIKSFN